MSRNDGGPAFPLPFIFDGTRGETGMYIDAADAGVPTGATLRDWFAAKALVGLIAEPPWHAGAVSSAVCIADIPESPAQEVFAVAAYRIADAMLAERAKDQQP